MQQDQSFVPVQLLLLGITFGIVPCHVDGVDGEAIVVGTVRSEGVGTFAMHDSHLCLTKNKPVIKALINLL
jgi:hypothetical protein